MSRAIEDPWILHDGEAPLVVADGVEKRYQKGRVTVAALRHVSLTVERGDFVAIMGPSGSGKSTLLHLLGALDRPTQGRVLFGGRDLATLGDRELSRLRNRAIGFVFQSYNLLPTMTAWENVALPLKFAGCRPAERKERALAALGAVGLAQRADHRPAELSGGEEQRVALARALVSKPQVILADEPTGNLDSDMTLDLMARLREVNLAGTAIVVVTHNPLVASYARRVAILRDGVVDRWMTPSQLARAGAGAAVPDSP